MEHMKTTSEGHTVRWLVPGEVLEVNHPSFEQQGELTLKCVPSLGDVKFIWLNCEELDFSEFQHPSLVGTANGDLFQAIRRKSMSAGKPLIDRRVRK